ncbi:DMT family transporter [Microbacterium sp. NEAU-LLC]|uniref:DMT family transporter n=1 Tax=Microbacterium helvum TaxID=2773713 RepID=A0ABR8NUC3_9MICO|nr:DMT family transporter [Microbacterium helvum]MBD3943648.1 DMT family transporter [Microbacterium helvum]
MTSTSPTAAVGATRAPSPTWITVQFVLAGIVWGSSFLFMKVALTGISPAQVAWTRILLGTVTLGILVLARREHLSRSVRVWGHLLVLGITFCVVPFLLFSWAQQHVSSGVASIFNATTPIMTAIMAWLVFRVERLKAMQVVGIGVGILGVIVIIAPWQGLSWDGSLIAELAILGATASYGFSFAYMRRFASNTGMSALAFTFGYIAMAGLVMALLTPFLVLTPVQLDVPIVVSLVLLGCLGTGIAYVWNQNTVRAWGPTRASTVTYITPVVGVVLGVLILGETVSWNEPVGALVVFLGILLAQDRLRRRPRTAPAGGGAVTASRRAGGSRR